MARLYTCRGGLTDAFFKDTLKLKPGGPASPVFELVPGAQQENPRQARHESWPGYDHVGLRSGSAADVGMHLLDPSTSWLAQETAPCLSPSWKVIRPPDAPRPGAHEAALPPEAQVHEPCIPDDDPLQAEQLVDIKRRLSRLADGAPPALNPILRRALDALPGWLPAHAAASKCASLPLLLSCAAVRWRKGYAAGAPEDCRHQLGRRTRQASPFRAVAFRERP